MSGVLGSLGAIGSGYEPGRVTPEEFLQQQQLAALAAAAGFQTREDRLSALERKMAALEALSADFLVPVLEYDGPQGKVRFG